MNKRTTVRVGEPIYAILKQFKKVYPLIADEGTTFPFIVYKRSSGYSQSNKDGIYSAIANVDIMVAADTYEESVELADKVITELEKSRGMIAGFDIWQIRMIDSNETYSENAFLQEMKFSVEFAAN